MTTSYLDLTNVPAFGKKREITFEPERGEIGFYCKDCRKPVAAIQLPPQKIGKKMREYLYQCPVCKGPNISIGTTASMKAVYDRKH